MSSLHEIAQEVLVCTKCGLASSRIHAVPGEGPDAAPVLFIGEGPGEHEDRQGRPFVGPAGQRLTDLLQSVRMPRERVYITNVVKCRPPGNRVPGPDEIAACLPYLVRQMAALRPRIVCLLGSTAVKAILGEAGVTRVRSRALWLYGRWVFATYHPSAALRDEGVAREIALDFRRLRRVVDVEWGTAESWSERALGWLFPDAEGAMPSIDREERTAAWALAGLDATFRTDTAIAELLRRAIAHVAGTPLTLESVRLVDDDGLRAEAAVATVAEAAYTSDADTRDAGA